MSAGESVLERERAEIERIDREVVRLIELRLAAARTAAAAKRVAGVSVVDPAQEAAVIRRAAEWAREMGIPDEEVRDLFWALVGLTRRAELSGGQP